MESNQLNLTAVIEQVGKEKNIDKETLVSALEAAMLSAARKKHGPNADLEARYNPDIGEVEVYEFRQIVKEVVNTDTEISFQDAKKLDPDLTEDAVGEDLGIKLDSKEFGRIAAQNAKQIIVQRVREAERSLVYEEYKDRKGELVTGIMRRFERGAVIVDLGRAEAVIPVREQIQKDSFRVGDRVMAYVVDVLEASRGAQIVLSRTHPNMVVKLFEQEVPEIAEGVVSVEGVAREAGFRSKIAVRSSDSDVDPVGACVGMKGARVQAVVQELRGEKIDIVPFDTDEARFVCNALAPAEVTRVLINEGDHTMQIVVPDEQLSLAIGRRGQNVRLAAELTGWKIDIHSETKVADERELAGASMSRVEGLSEFQIQTLYNHGFRRAEDVAEADEALLASMPGIEKEQVSKIIGNAKAVLAEEAKEGALEHDRARLQTRVLLQLDRMVADAGAPPLTNITDEATAQKLKSAGFDDIIDLYLMKFPEAAALSSQVSLEDLKALKKKAASSLAELTGLALEG